MNREVAFRHDVRKKLRNVKVKIISVGKTKENYWRLAEEDYVNRIKRYVQLELLFVKESQIVALKNENLVKKTEANSIREKIQGNEFIVALERKGRQMGSEKLAAFFHRKMLHSIGTITFVIGGPSGLSDDFLQQSDMLLSLSKMTFPHEMTRVILLEQIYRAFTILRGEKYHK